MRLVQNQKNGIKILDIVTHSYNLFPFDKEVTNRHRLHNNVIRYIFQLFKCSLLINFVIHFHQYETGFLSHMIQEKNKFKMDLRA